MEYKPLSQLALGQPAVVRAYATDMSASVADPMIARLMELGFISGTKVQIAHLAPFANDPLAVDVRGKRIAIRRSEAQLILVEEVK